MSAINVNSITGRTGTHGPVLTGVTTATNGLHVGSGISVSGISTFSNTVITGSLEVNGNNYPTAGSLSNRNIIINGAMNVSQRTTSTTSVTTTAYRACDRFKLRLAGLGTWTIAQDTSAPDGFRNSFKMTCTVADASPSADDSAIIVYLIEAQDAQRLAFGTPSAKSLTLSFWIKSNKTGNGTANLFQKDNSNKMVSYQYTINSANTWEYKTISIPGDTSGVINDDNGEGLQVEWFINSGSTFTGGSHKTTWATFDNNSRNASNLRIGGAVNDYIQITGVQLEVGTKATPFEYCSYGQTLAKCQRYFQQTIFTNGAGGNTGGTNLYANLLPIVSMRAMPTVSSTGTLEVNCNGVNSTQGAASVASYGTSSVNRFIILSGFSGLAQGKGASLRFNANQNLLTLDAEL